MFALIIVLGCVLIGLIVTVKIVGRVRRARQLKAMSPAERDQYDAILEARAEVKAAESVLRAATSKNAANLRDATERLKNAEASGTRLLSTLYAGFSKARLYEDRVLVRKTEIPLRKLRVNLLRSGGVEVTQQSTVPRAVAGAVLGHAVGSMSSRRHGAEVGAFVGGAIGASALKTVQTDTRRTDVQFFVDGVFLTTLVATGVELAEAERFLYRVTAEQDGYSARETAREVELAAAQAGFTAAEADRGPVTASRTVREARAALAALTDSV